VAAEDVDGVAADAQAGPGEEALVDGVADGGVSGTGTFGSHVAFGGEAGHEIFARCQDRRQGALRYRLLHGLHVFGAGVQEQVDVGVNQAGQEGAITEVDDFGSGRMSYRRAGFGDAVGYNEYFTGR
jgi:hypothetical protein